MLFFDEIVYNRTLVPSFDFTKRHSSITFCKLQDLAVSGGVLSAPIEI